MDCNTKRGYLFISNSRPLSHEAYVSKDSIKVSSFEAASLYAANRKGWKLFCGCNRKYADQLKSTSYDIVFYNQNIYRNIFDIRNNWIAYRQLCKFLERNKDIRYIHCNTPIGGVLGRICGHKYKKKVIYMVHGFHFFEHAPLVNRTLFKWIEQKLAAYTDLIITINREDFKAASQMHLKEGGKVAYVPGVGIDVSSFENIVVDKEKKKCELAIPQQAKIGIVVGDLNDNKNVEILIKSACHIKDLHLIICGEGPKTSQLKKVAKKLSISERVHFLGYRTDVKELCMISDVYLMASKREGLPRSTMEAMCAGLPCVVSKIRGNVDLIKDGKGGFLVHPDDAAGFEVAIKNVISNSELQKNMGNYNKEAIKKYDIHSIKEMIFDLFNSL